MAEGKSTVKWVWTTIKAPATDTGYSITAISETLRGSPVVSNGTRQTVVAAAKELSNQANARGLPLCTGKTSSCIANTDHLCLRLRLGWRRAHADH